MDENSLVHHIHPLNYLIISGDCGKNYGGKTASKNILMEKMKKGKEVKRREEKRKEKRRREKKNE